MTRKDYQLIARSIAATRARFTSLDNAEAKALDSLAEALADDLACENERFSRSTFLKACGNRGMSIGGGAKLIFPVD